MVWRKKATRRTVVVLLIGICFVLGSLHQYRITDDAGIDENGLAKLSEPFKQTEADGYINLLEVDPPKYLEEFKTPCWLEEMGHPPFYPEERFCRTKGPWRDLRKILFEQYKMGKTVRMRCLPYFHLIGFPKSGTSSLYRILTSHKHIMRSCKESQYWAEERGKRYSPIRQYVDLFDLEAMKVENIKTWDPHTEKVYHPALIGDGSTLSCYKNFGWSNLPENAGSQDGPRYFTGDYIYHITPQARIVIIFRNPTDRMFSDYKHFGGVSASDFHKVALRLTREMTECLKYHSEWACVNNKTYDTYYREFQIRRGLYPASTERWLRTFPSNQIYTAFFEDYVKDPYNITSEVFTFLGTEPLSQEDFESVQQRIKNYHPIIPDTVRKMLPQTRVLLDKFFKPFNERLADILQNKKALWHI